MALACLEITRKKIADVRAFTVIVIAQKLKKQTGKSKAPHHRPFVSGNHRTPKNLFKKDQ